LTVVNTPFMLIGAVLTVMIFSYILGDNFLYRIAVHIFVGAAAAYALIVAVESVLVPWFQPILQNPTGNIPQTIVGLLPLLVGLLLLAKSLPGLSRLGNLGLAAMLGVGTALALWGAISGTLLPLTLDAARNQGDPAGSPIALVDTVIAALITVAVLIYFTYLGQRKPNGDIEQRPLVRVPGSFGQAFIMITLGATYGLLIISALTILTDVIANRLMILKPG